MCVTHTGTKTFYFVKKVYGRPQRVRLGKFPGLTVDNPRMAVESLVGDVALGSDPAAERRERREVLTFGEAFEWYMKHHAEPHKKTAKVDRQRYDRHLKRRWRGRKLNTIRRRDIQILHTKVGTENGPYEANRLRALLHTIFGLAVDKELFDGTNPVKGAKRFAEKERERVLDGEELWRFFAALDEEESTKVRDYLRVLLFTGARRTNVLEMRWEEIDFTREVWRVPDSKSGEPLVLPLSKEALEVLTERWAVTGSCPWVFPGVGKTGHLTDPTRVWKRVLKRAGLENLRLHDLRRTLGSWGAMTGASLHVLAKALGHKQTSTTEIYARLQTDPIRAAVNTATSAMVEAAKGQAGGKDDKGQADE